MRVHEFAIGADFRREDLIDISSKSSRFMSDIKIYFSHEDNEHIVDVKSLLGMLLLPIHSGSMIRLVTRGKDEEEALEYMISMFVKQKLA